MYGQVYSATASLNSLDNLIVDVAQRLNEDSQILFSPPIPKNVKKAENLRWRVSGIKDIYDFLAREGAIDKSKYVQLVDNVKKLEMVLIQYIIHGLYLDLSRNPWKVMDNSIDLNQACGEDRYSMKMNKMLFYASLIDKRISIKPVDKTTNCVTTNIVRYLESLTCQLEPLLR